MRVCECALAGMVEEGGRQSSVDNNSSFHSRRCIRVSCAGDAESPAAVGGSEREEQQRKLGRARNSSVCVCVCVCVK